MQQGCISSRKCEMPPSFYNSISFVAFFLAIRAPINNSTITAYWLLNASLSKSTVSHKLGPGRSLTMKEKVALLKTNELKMITILAHGDICQKNLFPCDMPFVFSTFLF